MVKSQFASALEEVLDYSFSNPKLLLQAITHRSFVNENCQKSGKISSLAVADNERLEFLGDAVLGLRITELIYARFPEKSEGELSKLRSQIVNSKALARFSESLGLGEFLRLGRGETRQGGRQRASLLADTFEALLAALYLDGGEKVVRRLTADLLNSELQITSTDYKSRLQEQLQELKGHPPVYELVGRSGADHRPCFFIEVYDEAGILLGSGSGSSRKSAEQQAAKNALAE